MRTDKTLRWVIPTLLVLAPLTAFLLPWRCSAQTGTAGTISNSIDYTARQDEMLTEQYGDWKPLIRTMWREGYRNWLSTAREGYQQRRASLFDADGLERYLTQTEARQVSRALDSARARKAIEDQRIADSIAAAQTQGTLIIEKDGYRAMVTDPELVSLNRLQPAVVGKAYSPRLDFLDGLIAPSPSEAPAPAPPSGLPITEGGFITYVYVVHALAIVGLVAIGIWLIP
jgi:hypothetical protein